MVHTHSDLSMDHCANSSVSILSHFTSTEFITNISECENVNCTAGIFDVTKTYEHTKLLRSLAWINWVGTAFFTFVSVINIYREWIKEKNKIEGWPWKKEVYGIKVSRFQCFPKWFVGFGLICKLVPSLTMDVVDILTDTLYFDQITQQCGVLDPRLHTPLFVYHILFIFMVIGMIKNLSVNQLARRQLTKKLPMNDLSESDLVDSNAYMSITFFQGVLSFVFQDAAAAIVQFFFVDKYVKETNMTATFTCIVMLLFSLRVTYVFTRYLYQYWSKTDPVKLKILHVIMLGTKGSVTIFHAMRSYAVVFSKMFEQNDLLQHKEMDTSCFSNTVKHGVITTVQDPFQWNCMEMLDKTLIAFTIIASIGVVICTVLVCFVGFEHFTIFNQSHYSGRVGNITGVGQKVPVMNRPQIKGLNISPKAFDPSISRATELERPENYKQNPNNQ